MAKKRKIRLGVNLDHVATLRQVRGGTTKYPDLFFYVKQAVDGGADQITIHLREDRRHIQDSDAKLLARKCPVSLNLEMAATKEMLKIAKSLKPDWVCLVPEKRQELTTEGGLNVDKSKNRLKKMVSDLNSSGIKVSMFVDASSKQIQASQFVGAQAVELHTGTYVLLKGERKKREWARLKNAAIQTHELGMNVHAGHGLDYRSAKKLTQLPFIEELNIGHFLVCEALSVGMKKSVHKMKKHLK